MYIGSYIHNLDDKNRLSIPKKWKDLIGKSLILTAGLDGSIFLYDKKHWEKIISNVGELSFLDKDSRNFSRFMLSNAFDIDIDSHGRILVPDNLKAIANLNTEVTLVGVGNRIELWDKEIFDKQISNINAEAEDLAKRIHDLSGK